MSALKPAISPVDAGRDGFNIGLFLSQAAAREGDRPALIQGARSWSYAEIDAGAGAFAAALIALGCVRGTRLLVQARNSHVFFEAMWGAWRAGAVWAPLNFRLSPRETAYAAARSGAAFLLCDPEFAEHAREALAARPALKVIWTSAEADGGCAYSTLCAAHSGAATPFAAVAEADPCWMFFTSGTTGRPKAALLGHAHMAAVTTTFIADVLPGLGRDDVFLAPAPLSHGAGIQLLANVARAAATVLTEGRRLDPEEVWTLVERHRVSNIFTVPTLLRALVEDPSVDRHDRSSLRYVTYSGSPMYRADQKLALEKLGPVLVQLYGLAEVTAGITVLPTWAHSLDGADQAALSCGFSRTGMNISIQSEDGAILGAGQDGLVCVKGQNVFLGYHDDPSANAACFRAGWFRTGDIGRLDARGFLTLTGRASDMFISGGNNIYPLEIEEVLRGSPDIAEVAVLGMPDAHWGEIGVAVVVADAPGLDEEKVLGLLGGKLAKYKWPRRVVFWPDLPKTGYGKVSKPEIRALLEKDAIGTSAA